MESRRFRESRRLPAAPARAGCDSSVRWHELSAISRCAGPLRAIRALPAAGGRAGRRPAFQAVPAILRMQLYALCGPPGRVPAGGGRSKPSPRFFARSFTRFAALRAACRPEAGRPSRPRDSSPAALRALRPSGPRAGRRPAFQAVPAILRPQPYALCGPPGRVPAGGRRSKPSPRFFARSFTRFAALRAACRPEAGRPSRPRDSSPAALRALRPSGPRAGRRPAFQAVPAVLLAQRCAVARRPPPLRGRARRESPR